MKAPSPAYVLCSNPRSGTTMLCNMLAQTGVAGRPDSFFRQQSIGDWCADWGITRPFDIRDAAFTQDYFHAMKREGQGATPVFGLRLMQSYLAFACNWLALRHPHKPSNIACFDAAFGTAQAGVAYIHLSRQDKLAEAVSYLRAEQSGLWHAQPDGIALEQLPPTAPPGYDAAAITRHMADLTASDRRWDAWFAAQNITPLRLSYEGLAAHPRQTLADVLTYLGQDPAHASTVTPGTRKLADAVSGAWIAHYRAADGPT